MLVTGAAGLTGSAVVRLLRSRGTPTLSVVRPRPDNVDPGAESETRVELDLASTGALDALTALPPLAGIVHCAAGFPVVDSGPDAERSADVNQRMDSNVASLARDHAVRVVYCSSASVYGDPVPGSWVREGDPLRPAGPYAGSKVAGERGIRSTAPSSASLRITSPYGPAMTKSTVLRAFAARALAGEDVTYFGSGDRTQDFVHCDDVARACIAALLRTDVDGPVNVCAGAEVSMRDLAELTVRLAGTSAVARSVDRVDPQAGRRACYDRTLARERLGWEPSVTLASGLVGVMEAMREAAR